MHALRARGCVALGLSEMDRDCCNRWWHLRRHPPRRITPSGTWNGPGTGERQSADDPLRALSQSALALTRQARCLRSPSSHSRLPTRCPFQNDCLLGAFLAPHLVKAPEKHLMNYRQVPPQRLWYAVIPANPYPAFTWVQVYPVPQASLPPPGL